MKRRVVVTGLGAITPIGIGTKTFWDASLRGDCGTDVISLFDAGNYSIKIAAEVKGFDPSQFMLPEIHRKADRFAQMGLAAAKMAIEDAQLDSLINEGNNRIPVILGSGLGGSMFHEEQIFQLIENKEPRKVLSSSVPRITPNAVSAWIAIQFKLRGSNMVISTACSSAANAIGLAAKFIRTGEANTVVTGGVECPISPFTFAAYQSMRVLSTGKAGTKNVPRPFDKNRDGFVLGEGAGLLVLEDMEQAVQRNAPIYAEIKGFSSNCGIYHMAAPDPSGEDAAAVVSEALRDAQLQPSEVDYINAHGTATKANDLCESKAIGLVFGPAEKGPYVSSTKSQIGHTIGAAGAIELIITIQSINKGIVTPTINLDEPDPELDLDYVANVARNHTINCALSNSFAFGGHNAVLVVKKYL